MKVVIITGASRGLGREIALELDRYNYKFVLAARSLEGLKQIKKELKSETLIVPTNISKYADVTNLFQKTIKTFGRVDIVINNAGINFQKLFYEYTEEEYDSLMNVNTKAVFLACREAQKHMKKGKIVIISSIAGLFSARFYSIYSASKHALEGFVKGARKESDLKFSIFHPFSLDTDFGKGYKYKNLKKYRLNPRFYAQYVVAKIRGEHILALFYFIRNHLMWLFKITVPMT